MFRSPSFLPSVILENHWTYWLALLGIAAILFFVGRSRAQQRLITFGWSLAAFTLFWVILAQLLDTPRERLYFAHLGLKDAAAHGDVDAFTSYLSPSLHVSVLGIDFDATDKDKITEILKSNGIRESHITSYKSSVPDVDYATSEISVITESQAGAIPTHWRLAWRDIPGSTWRIEAAEWVPSSNSPMPAPP